MNGVQVYGVFFTPEEERRMVEDARLGIVRYHETTYLECSIPKELEDELYGLIEDRVRKWESNCQCEDCKNKEIKNE